MIAASATCARIALNCAPYPLVSGYRRHRQRAANTRGMSSAISMYALQTCVRSNLPLSSAFHHASGKFAGTRLCPVSACALPVLSIFHVIFRVAVGPVLTRKSSHPPKGGSATSQQTGVNPKWSTRLPITGEIPVCSNP
jgi:hypothetical protein